MRDLLLATSRVPKRVAISLLLFVALILIAVQVHLLHELSEERVRLGKLLIPSPNWRLWGVLVPAFLIASALLWWIGWSTRGRRLLSILLAFGFCSFVGLVWMVNRTIGQAPIQSVPLFAGSTVILAENRTLFGSSYSLYVPFGRGGIYWREATYVDLGRFDETISGELGLALAPDGKWLLVRRNDLWVDCLRIQAAALQRCQGQPNSLPLGGSPEQYMRARSNWIAAHAGVPQWPAMMKRRRR